MADKRKKYEIVHPQYYFCVGGKLQKVPKGSIVLLTAEQAKKAGAKVKKAGESKPINENVV